MDIEVKELSKEAILQIQQENENLKKELNGLKLYFTELEETNNHLVSATWREREMKKKLTQTLGELNNTKQIVESQNKRITESINYSRKIQLAINPTEQDLLTYNSDSFILYLPKDVISGDFPWLFETGDFLYMAAVDCTGHGVPGAMMSMIGNLLLNDITNDGTILMPSVVLRRLHEAVVKTLKQDSSDINSNDGMDIGLCCIDKKNKQLIFSGAHRPLFFLRNGSVEIVPGDKFPIGGMHYKGLNKFTDHTISYQEGDAIFLFTDGLPDQTGGELNRKLMTRNLKEFIELNGTCKMQDFKNTLYNHLIEWKGQNKQVDDILILGMNF